MPLVLNGATSGSTTVTPTDAVTVSLTLPSTGGTLQTSGSGYTTNGVAYATSTSVLATGSALTWSGTKLTINGSTGTTALQVGLTNATNNPYLAISQSESGSYSKIDANGTTIAACNLVFATAGSEAMRLTSAGYLGIGTSSPAQILHVSTTTPVVRIDATAAYNASPTGILSFVGTYNSGGGLDGFANITAAKSNATSGDGSAYLAFSTNTSTGNMQEKMRIDSSGNLLVACTTSGETSSTGFRVLSNGQVASTESASTNASFSYLLYSTGASAYRFYVGLGGTVYATSTTITAISDQRLKENIRDLDEGLATVLALKPRKFDWKEGKGANIKNARGFIAQEFETVLPDMIEEWRDPAPQGEEPYKAINANLIPTLVKAIQELNTLVTTQAETITSMQATITALQTKVGV